MGDTKHTPSCPTLPSPGLMSLEQTDCGASPWCWSGQGPSRPRRREKCHTGGAAAELLLQAWELQAGCHLPSPTQTKYPALRVSEKFLASACPGPSGLKSPSSMEPGLLSALSLFFLFLTPGAQADWQTYPSMEGRALALGSSQEEGVRARDRGSQRPSESKRQSKKT